MAVLSILRYPDARLHTIAKPVGAVDDRVRQLVSDMAETMYAAPGIGLAATQVDVHEEIIVIDTSEDKSELLVFINPKIIASSDDLKVFDEGCLSVPGIYEEVERPDRVKIKALNQDGKSDLISPCCFRCLSARISITSIFGSDRPSTRKRSRCNW